MALPFQPSLREPADLPPLRQLLRRCPTLADLEAELARHLAEGLEAAAAPLREHIPEAGALDTRSLATHVVPLLVQVTDSGMARRAQVGDACLGVPLAAQGMAAGYWSAGATTPERALHEALNTAEWVVNLAPRLRGWMQSWLVDEPWFDNLWPVERHELARRLAIALGQVLESAGPLLKALLLLRLGYPVDFLRGYLRELGRGTPHPTPGEIACLLREWPTLRRWPWRARKLACLALPLRESGALSSLEIRDVRDFLRSQGLPRNAWGRLHRIPLPQLRDLGLTLAQWQAADRPGEFLAALGLLLSRLGPDARFYRAWHAQAPEVLSDIPSRIAALRCGQRVPVPGERQQWYRLQRHGLSLRMLNSVVPGAAAADDQVEKATLLLIAVARYLLAPAPRDVLARRREEVSDLVDWFRARCAELPPQAFRGDVPALLRQSRQWHERRVAERERRAQEERQQRLEQLRLQQAQAPRPPREQDRPRPRAAAGRGPWSVPLREHAWCDFRFLVLHHEAELDEEATAMKHCVDGYGMECLRGECHIVGIRWGTLRIATLELRRDWGGRWEQVQLKGKGNAFIGHDFEMQGQLLRHGIADFLRAFNDATRNAGGPGRAGQPPG